ncbi:hypothetical protein [Empedobacter falsenii]|uniref:Lipopolysaccharide biosynthesis protein n=1 Tax=Empedobacter falsenii TaxID=343874 RepID=A0A3R8UB41_9FLAO|nr:hypothetical protein [Empedobacter falsenii]RRT86734.1 hypothetical protein EGI88_14110 [Empedobacter falsenii]RRT87938.1 hypothetical protein EGI89_14195 [Empedobacter falsenii]
MPSVLFIYKNTNLAQQFAKHFKLNGYSLYEFYDEEIPYYEFSGLQRLENIYYRVIKKNTQHIHNINNRNFINFTNKKLNSLKNKNLKFDYCFVIRGDLIPENVLEYARSVSTKMIDYQLDGLAVSEKILEFDNLFDQIYVFDDQDVVNYPKYNLKAITNCFFEEDNHEKIDWDIYYTGAGLDERVKKIKQLINQLKATDFKLNINLLRGKDLILADNVKFIKHGISYEENILLTKKSNVLLDFKREEHDGLSLRFFEALNFNKKIITDNKAVVKYDFYNPRNIYITDFVNFNGLIEFLEIPYQEIDDLVKQKYNFKNWIQQIL